MRVGQTVAMLCVVSMLAGCDQEGREREQAQKAARKVEVARQCALTGEIIGFARGLGRSDLVEPESDCATFFFEDCRINVELLVALAKVEKAALGDHITSVGKNCAAEH